MGLLEALKKALQGGQGGEGSGERQHDHARKDGEVEDVRVPEVTSTELMAETQNGSGDQLLLLDIREPFERAQALIPNSLHIPMNSLPSRLAEVDSERKIVVYCAHGNRSYGVTAWLIQQGYEARSLKGGIVDWQHKHGPIERGYKGRS